MSYIPKFIRTVQDKDNREKITSDEWNIIINFLTEATDNNSEALQSLINDGNLDIPAILDLAGVGRTTETVKQNADDIISTNTELASQVTALQVYADAAAQAAKDSLLDGAGSAFDTLAELQAALGDDPNFATTIANDIGTKMPIAGGNFTGPITIQGATPLDTFNFDPLNYPEFVGPQGATGDTGPQGERGFAGTVIAGGDPGQVLVKDSIDDYDVSWQPRITVAEFTHLGDTPNDFVAHSGELVKVKEDETGLEFSVPNNNSNTGIVEGMVLSVGSSSNLFSISSGTYNIITNTNPSKPKTNRILFAGVTDVATTNIATTALTYVGIDENQNIIQQSSQFSHTQLRTIAFVGVLAHLDKTNITVVRQDAHMSGYQPYHNVVDLIGHTPVKESGGFVEPDNGFMRFKVSASRYLGFGINRDVSLLNPNTKDFAAKTSNVTFRYLYRDGAGGLSSTAIYTDLDPTMFDDGTGVLSSISNVAKYTNQYIYMSPASGLMYVMPGQTEYVGLTDADLAKRNRLEIHETPSEVSDSLVLIAIITMQGNDTDIEYDSRLIANITTSTSYGVVTDSIDVIDDVKVLNTSVVAELSAFANQQNINEYLSAELDGKLDLTGGTVTGDLGVNTVIISNEIKMPANAVPSDVSLGCNTDGDTGFNWDGAGGVQFISESVEKYDMNDVYHTNNKPTPADIGAVKSAILNSVEVDMDNYVEEGAYVTPNSSQINVPSGWSSTARHIMVVNGNASTTYIRQTLIENGNNRVATRIGFIGSLPAWSEISTNTHYYQTTDTDPTDWVDGDVLFVYDA